MHTAQACIASKCAGKEESRPMQRRGEKGGPEWFGVEGEGGRLDEQKILAPHTAAAGNTGPQMQGMNNVFVW